MTAIPATMLVGRVPACRCCTDHETPVVALCSACHRPLCRFHDTCSGWPDFSDARRWVAHLLTPRRERRRKGAPKSPSHGSSRERNRGEDDRGALAVDAALPQRPEQARERERHLCPTCVPWDRWNDPEVLTGTASLVAGSLVLLLAPGMVGDAVASLLIVLSVVRLAVRVVRARLRRRRRRDLPPLRGVDPRIRRLQATERITAEAELDDGLRYTTRVTGTCGTLKVDAQWGRAQAHRLEVLRRRHPQLNGTDSPWSAGYLLLRGRPQVSPEDDRDVEVVSPTVLHLTARESDHPALDAFASRGDARWTIEASYGIREDREPERFAVWVVPTIVPREGQRSLDLEVHWRSTGEHRYEHGPSMRKLDLVRIEVPGRWGALETSAGSTCHARQAHPFPTVSTPDLRGLRTVEWRNIPVRRTSRGRHCLRLRFEDPVDLSDAEVLVRVEARFAGALSGLDEVSVHHAGGAPRSEAVDASATGGRTLRAAPFTVVELEARLRLAGLRYEDVLSLPSRSGVEGRELTQPHTYPATAPGHATVTRLADELSRAGYYVKRVAENPPRAGSRAMTVVHSWNVGGRFYDGVYPIDFDLSIDGEETEKSGQVSGSTSATLHIRGAYTTDELKQRVLAEWSTLWNHVDVALSGLRRGEGALGLPDSGASPFSDLEDILALIDDGIRHGRISEPFAEKLISLLRPPGPEGEEGP